jgi:hypothetical protein
MLKSLRPTVSERCISDWTFDAWRAGELDKDGTVALEEHLTLCERCQRRRESIERQAVQFWDRAGALPTRPSGSRPVRRRWLVPSAVAFSALAAVAVIAHLAPGSREAADEVRRKGQSHITFHVQHGGKVTAGTDGQTVFPGDRLRFSITTGKPVHVAILSLDGVRVASVYFPPGKTSRSFGVVNSQPLDSSVLLDGTLGNETVWALFCDKEFDLAPLRAQLEREGRLSVPAGCSLDQHTLVKRAAP